MKKTLAILLLLAFSMVSCFAFADSPQNADLLTPWEEMIVGDWKLASTGVSAEWWKGLGEKFTIAENDGDFMLFITPNNEIYLAWKVKKDHKGSHCAKISFSADGQYMMLIKGDDGVVYTKK